MNILSSSSSTESLHSKFGKSSLEVLTTTAAHHCDCDHVSLESWEWETIRVHARTHKHTHTCAHAHTVLNLTYWYTQFVSFICVNWLRYADAHIFRPTTGIERRNLWQSGAPTMGVLNFCIHVTPPEVEDPRNLGEMKLRGIHANFMHHVAALALTTGRGITHPFFSCVMTSLHLPPPILINKAAFRRDSSM